MTSGTQTTKHNWIIDASHSEIGFSIRHLMISRTRGGFNAFEANAQFDPDHIEHGTVSVQIDAASIDTRDEQRDEHLRSPDFFDVASFPTIGFQSTSVESTGADSYNIHGNLTIRGTSRPITLRASFTDVISDPFGGVRLGVSASTEINRADFGLIWNSTLETGGVMLGEKVEITIDAEFVVND